MTFSTLGLFAVVVAAPFISAMYVLAALLSLAMVLSLIGRFELVWHSIRRGLPIWLQATLAAIATWLLVTVIIHVIALPVKDSESYGQFIQLSFSSWPRIRPDNHSWAFALGVSARLTLVLATVASLIGLFQGIVKIRRVISMNYANLIEGYDLAVKAKFMTKIDGLAKRDALPTDPNEIYEILVEAIDEAKVVVKRELERLYSPEAAERLLRD